MNIIRNRLSLIFIVIFVCLLTSCTGLSLATSGARAVYNRHELQQQLSDHYITMQAYNRIYDDSGRFDDTNLSITTLNNEVLLTGEVTSQQQLNAIVSIVKKIPNISEIHCHIRVSGKSSALTRVSDSWITAKVKSKFLASNDLDVSRIKVVTENGTVYLMGIVFPDEAPIAVEIAQNTLGVQDVVKYFSYMRISKT